MRSTCRNAVQARVPCSAQVTLGLLIAAVVLAPSSDELQAAGEKPAAAILAQAGGATAEETADAKAGENKQLPEEQKHKVKSAVLMLSILSGIALSGLLLIIVAIAVRGLQRKLSGPTRLDCRPQDVLPDAVGRTEKETGAAGQTEGSDQASEETLFT